MSGMGRAAFSLLIPALLILGSLAGAGRALAASVDVGDEVRVGYGRALGAILALDGLETGHLFPTPPDRCGATPGAATPPRERSPGHLASHPYVRPGASHRLALRRSCH